MPLQEITSQYAQLRQELPPESTQLARECQAFQRARVIQSADELLYLVLLYSIADLSGGRLPAFARAMAKRSVTRRCASAWPPAQVVEGLWANCCRQPLPPRAAGSWQLVICDGSQISGPGAQGTDYRWHVAYDPVAQQIRTCR